MLPTGVTPAVFFVTQYIKLLAYVSVHFACRSLLKLADFVNCALKPCDEINPTTEYFDRTNIALIFLI